MTRSNTMYLIEIHMELAARQAVRLGVSVHEFKELARHWMSKAESDIYGDAGEGVE